MSQKIFVTGVAGFIGSHLCESLLGAGNRVVGVDSLHANYDVRFKRDNLKTLAGHRNFSFTEGSLNDLPLSKLLEGVSCVFHLAAQAGVRDSWQERFGEYVDNNVRATQRLCEAARACEIAKFVYASSSSVYGEAKQLPMSEAHPTHPVSPYGVTKLAGEALCLLYGSNYQLPVVALRFFTVFGPRQRPDMAFHKFIKAGLQGRPIVVLGNGTQTRDFTFVSDVVDACRFAMEYSGKSTVFNVGGGTRITLNSVLDMLSGMLQESLDVQYEDAAKGDVAHTYADIDLARRELGYSPKIGIEEGIAREVEWLKAIHGRMGGS
jgi:UDP-glucose 4-epimerase